MTVEPMVAKQWEAVLESLRAQLPSSTYHTWVLAAEPLACEDGVLTIGVVNAYAREKLLRDSPEVQRAAGQVLDATCVSRSSRWAHPSPGNLPPWTSKRQTMRQAARSQPSAMSPIASRYLSRYEEIVRPERVVSIPRYYLRWIPYLGVDLAWIPIAFRQVAYFRGLGFEAGDQFQCSHRELALWAGMSERNLYRKINDPQAGLVHPAGGPGGRLVGGQGWGTSPGGALLGGHDVDAAHAGGPAVARALPAPGGCLRAQPAQQRCRPAYDAPLDELLPLPDSPDLPEIATPARGVEQVVERALSKDVHQPEMKKLLAALSIKIGGYGESIEITHYFLRQHLPLPTIGGGRGWLVQVLRGLSQQQGHPAETVVSGGQARLGTLLGVSTATVRRWMSETRSAEGWRAGS